MAYISPEKVKEIRDRLKVEFPSKKGWKLSVTGKNYSSLNVAIMEAPVKFTEKDYEQLNPYHLHTYSNSKHLQKISDICNETNFNKSDSMTDYHHVGFYFHLDIGKWDRPFKLVKPKKAVKKTETKKVVETKPIPTGLEIEIIDYSEKAIAVKGDTKPIKDELSALGGRFNFRLNAEDGSKFAGWVFPKTKLDEVKNLLNL